MFLDVSFMNNMYKLPKTFGDYRIRKMDIPLSVILLLVFIAGFVEGISKLKHYVFDIIATFESTIQLVSIFFEVS